MENKKKLDKTTKILIGIFVIIVLLIGLLFSYAYYSLDVGGTLSNSNITGTLECLDISYTESNSINLTNAHPVTDDYALTKMTPVTVTITNNCSSNQGDISYTLALSTIYEKALNYDDKYIPDTKIRTHVKKTVKGAEVLAQSTKFLNEITKLDTTSNSYKYITNNFTNDSSFTNYNIKDMYKLDSGLIKNNEVITYKVYMWIDYYEGDPRRVGEEYNNSTKGKKFEGAISLVANAEEYVEPTFAEKLIATADLWQSGLEGDGYRYTGSGNATASTTPNNFICFGTTSLSECKVNEDKYMYRIIGVFPSDTGEQHLKLIKYKQLSTTYMWNENYSTDTSWENSDLYKGLNGISGGSYSKLFIGNATYNYLQDDKWLNKIADWKWTATNTLTRSNSGPNYHNITTEQIYLHEMNKTKPTEECISNGFTGGTCDFNIGSWTYPIAKIGLMYASDYQMSLGSSSLTMTSSDNKATLKTGWMHQSNNDTTARTYEWTLSRIGDTGGNFSIFAAWYVDDNGDMIYTGVLSGNGLRPVFYLDSTVTTSGGTGEYSNPYLING